MANYERGSSDDVRVFDGGEDEEDVEGSRLPLLIVIALLVLAAFGAVVYLAYQRGVSQGHTEIRELAAAPGPAKGAPTNAGGTPTPYTGLKIYQQPAPSDDQADTGGDVTPPVTPPAANTTAPKPAPVAATPAPAVTPPPKPVETATPKPVEIAPKPLVTPPAMTAAATPPKPTPAPTVAPPKPAPVTPPKPAPSQTAAATPPPAVTPPPKPVEAATPAPAAGSGFLQIGSYNSQAEAAAAWAAYKAKHAGAVGGLSNNIQSADLGAKGTWYRLRIVTGSQAEAATLCTKLKAEGGDCIVAK